MGLKEGFTDLCFATSKHAGSTQAAALAPGHRAVGGDAQGHRGQLPGLAHGAPPCVPKSARSRAQQQRRPLCPVCSVF